ncbi:hypothetical protein RHMOL_Rhmol09G0207500 [Rhododendron molle]|uniref:Uncharacterized protein n=1 Tax=Rhododendron molle TaxID=49168 RepID=A0ACC0MGS0_RHOML|nr:hypothetical protein RHMOL_Rhmol09G0207500 [Rhododendron molle]
MSDVAERLPCSLHQHFPANRSGTWILLKHGLKAWPIEIVDHEFRKGWDVFHRAHMLQADHKLILACERKWIFHTVIFDERGWELVFDWSGPNGRWHDLPPPSACLPSLVIAHNAAVKFLYFHVYGPELRNEFETHLKHIFKMLVLEQMVIRMAARTWTISIQGLHLNIDAFNKFAASLNSQFLNHIMVVMLPTVEFCVIVFDGRYDSERIYTWFSPVIQPLLSGFCSSMC